MKAARTPAAAPRDHTVSVCAHMVAQLLSFCWFCFREVLGVEALWPVLMAVNALPALVHLLTLPFFADSPRYLLIDKKDKEGCIKGKEMGHKASISTKSGECSKAPHEPGRQYSWEKDSWSSGSETTFSFNERRLPLAWY